MNKLLFLGLLFFVLVNIGCEPRQEFSIKVNGVTTSFINRGTTSINEQPFESNLENPIVTGQILLEQSLEEQQYCGYCCRRVLLNVTGSSSNILSSNFVKICRCTLGDNNSAVCDYESTSISLPADHTPIELSIQVGNTTYLHSTVKLRDDIIVIPVYVHLFSGEGANSIPFSAKQIAACFDLPNFTTTAVSVNNPNASRVTTENLEYSFASAPPDTIWKQAGIQFKLVNVDVIRNDTYNRQIISNSNRVLAGEVHARFQNTPGFHIYFGGNNAGILVGGQTNVPLILPDCDPSRVPRMDSYIIMPFNSRPFSLAHELGHMLGLKHVAREGEHVDFRENCARDYNSGLNLMTSPSSGAQLTNDQIARAKAVACKYLEMWNLPNRSCN